MKDPKIEKLVKELHSSVANVNVIMEKLQNLNVDVKIAYNDPKSPGIYEDVIQSIKVWRVEERNDYL
jgi:hypothetical protein